MLTQEENELLVLLNSTNVESFKSPPFEVYKSSELNDNIVDIMEGFDCFLSSSDGLKQLYPVADLESTLNPDFDDEDYVDDYAELWEAFVVKLLEKKAQYLIIINE